MDVSACLQEPVLNLYMCYFTALHLDVSVYKGLCYTCLGMSPRAILLYLDVSARLYTYMYKGLCCTCSRVNVCFFVLHMSVYVYKSFLLHLDVSV